MIRIDGLGLQYEQLRGEIDTAIHKVLESGWFIMGGELEAVEKEFADYLGCAFSVGVASGTDAISLSLLALGIGRGSEVITSSMTAFPTIVGIMKSGAMPVVVDIDYNDGLMDVTCIEEKISKRTKALLPVHLYGQSCDMGAVREIAEKYDLKIVEDCAQSVGAAYKQKKTGCFGDTGAFSFYPTKNLGAYGDGGAVVTNDPDVYEKLLRLRNYGKAERDEHIEFGFNSRLDEIQAAILRVKLHHLERWNEKRREHASFYREHLKTVSCLEENSYGSPVFHQFVIQSEERDRLMDFLKEKGIQSLVHYPKPVHKQKAFPQPTEETLRHAERFSENVLSIPVYPELSERDRNTIVRVINEFK